MAAVTTHILVGVLVAGLAGVRTRHLPWAGLFAEWIDLDHLFVGPGPTLATASGGEPIWLMNRATFHNVWVVAVIPAGIALYLCARRVASADVRRFAVAAPAILSSHTFFDMVALGTGRSDNGSAAFYPFSLERVGFDVLGLVGAPAYFDALSFALLVAVGLGLAARLLTAEIDDGSSPGDGEADPAAGEVELTRTEVARLAAFGILFGVLVPLLTWAASQPTGLEP